MDLNALETKTMTLTTTLLMDSTRIESIPYTFDTTKLDKDKVEELDIFFNVIKQDIEDEQETYKLNH